MAKYIPAKPRLKLDSAACPFVSPGFGIVSSGLSHHPLWAHDNRPLISQQHNQQTKWRPKQWPRPLAGWSASRRSVVLTSALPAPSQWHSHHAVLSVQALTHPFSSETNRPVNRHLGKDPSFLRRRPQPLQRRATKPILQKPHSGRH